MPAVQVTIVRDVHHAQNVINIKKNINEMMNMRMHEAVEYLKAKIKIKLTGTRTGQEYYIAGIGRHIASAPGEPPARMLGKLSDSIFANVTNMQTVIEGEVGSALKVDGWLLPLILELGRYMNGFVAPRPFLRSTFMEELPTLIRILKGHKNIGGLAPTTMRR